MKLSSILIAASWLSSQAFGVQPNYSVTKKVFTKPTGVKSLSKGAPSSNSQLFRDTSVTRGGAVPGWAAYNEALEKKPLITKALTSLVGEANTLHS